jgi:hypothetical protein
MLLLSGRPNAFLKSHVLWDTLYILCSFPIKILGV